MSISDPGRDAAADGNANAWTLPHKVYETQPWVDELPPLPWQVEEMSAPPPPPGPYAYTVYDPTPRRSLLLLLFAIPLTVLLILSGIGLALLSSHHLIQIQIVSSATQETGGHASSLGATPPDRIAKATAALPLHASHHVTEGIGPRVDLHAAATATPAATAATPPAAMLAVSPTQLALTCTAPPGTPVQPGAPMQPASAADAGTINVVITNHGGGSMQWMLATEAGYQFSQSSGVLAAGQSQVIGVSAITSSGSIAIDAGDALDSPQTISVQSC